MVRYSSDAILILPVTRVLFGLAAAATAAHAAGLGLEEGMGMDMGKFRPRILTLVNGGPTTGTRLCDLIRAHLILVILRNIETPNTIRDSRTTVRSSSFKGFIH
ncbi:unnamed protein product [Fusarium venenatum]|uniref:Secreted protein n=1 Tax=Fusarium venenatum TaxID=56646 RepID=A0A2L2TCD2_9HYPO|nr:uncharacterized protein FVRRES_02185 [Fusarium venenatum]CEI65673.1 unnamed protein product [Fusarium venenatum]